MMGHTCIIVKGIIIILYFNGYNLFNLFNYNLFNGCNLFTSVF